MALDAWTKDRINKEIDIATAEIEAVLWSDDHENKMDRAKVLISKRMGLRILLGERAVKLKPPAPHIVANIYPFDSMALAA